MARFNSSRLDWHALVCMLSLWVVPVQGAINFNQLNDCNAVAKLYKALRQNDLPGCTAPTDAVSLQILSRVNTDTVGVCLLKQSPVDSLAGFRCIRSTIGEFAAVTCYRLAKADEIERYQQNYRDDYAAVVQRYRNESAECSMSNGDAATAQNSLLPPLLAPIARFEFGSIVGLGTASPPDSAMVHGFATIDPMLGDRLPSAIEFVEMTVGRGVYQSPYTRERSVGHWAIGIDEAREFDEQITKAYQQQGAPFQFNSRAFAIGRSALETLSQDEKLEILAGLHEDVAFALRVEGLEEFDDDEIEELLGRNKQAVIRELMANSPYAYRNSAGANLAPSLRILVGEDDPKCTQHGQGAMMVYLLAFQPIPQVKSDYGEAQVIVAGMGACGDRSRSSTRRYMDELLMIAEDDLVESLSVWE